LDPSSPRREASLLTWPGPPRGSGPFFLRRDRLRCAAAGVTIADLQHCHAIMTRISTAMHAFMTFDASIGTTFDRAPWRAYCLPLRLPPPHRVPSDRKGPCGKGIDRRAPRASRLFLICSVRAAMIHADAPRTTPLAGRDDAAAIADRQRQRRCESRRGSLARHALGALPRPAGPGDRGSRQPPPARPPALPPCAPGAARHPNPSDDAQRARDPATS